MVDAQARERCWRIGQLQDVTVYRLILAGTIEEKIYQRQVYKQFMAHKVLVNPQDARVFSRHRMEDLFEEPPAPPGFDFDAVQAVSRHFAAIFRRYHRSEADGVETVDLLADFVAAESEAEADEQSATLEERLLGRGLQAIFSQNRVDEPAAQVVSWAESRGRVQLAFDALARSRALRAQHDVAVPTWTGRAGEAGMPAPECRPRRAARKGSDPAVCDALTAFFSEAPGHCRETSEVAARFGGVVSTDELRACLKQLCKFVPGTAAATPVWILRATERDRARPSAAEKGAR